LKRGMYRDPSDAEDLRKVEELLAGDRRAFEFLFEKYREKVYGIAFRFLHNRDDALEVTQEVFLRVHQGLSGFKTNSKFFTWLYRIAANRAIDFARARKTRKGIEVEAPAREDGTGPVENTANPTSDDPAELAERKERSERLLEAIRALSPKHRLVFVLHAIENLSYKDISEVAGCSIGTVMSRLFYARKKLQDLLSDYRTVRS
jgi:RNA polymerase sigma-70 factor, ECF subfamily